jgi:uncharacterized integral membrane protein
MKRVTLAIWVIILGFIALVIFQNQDFFMSHHSLRLNLGLYNGVLPPDLPIAVVFLFFFFCGLVISYLFSFSNRFKARRTVKKLNAAIATQKSEVTELKSELDTLKGQETPAVQQAADSKTDTEEIIELTGDRLVENPADQKEANPNWDSKEKNNKEK